THDGSWIRAGVEEEGCRHRRTPECVRSSATGYALRHTRGLYAVASSFRECRVLVARTIADFAMWGSMNIDDIRNFPSQKECWDATLYLQEAYIMGARK